MDKPHLLDLTQDELIQQLQKWAEPPFRARQVWQMLFKNLITSFQGMSALPKSLQSILENNFEFLQSHVVESISSKDHRAVKYLIALNDNKTIESVLLVYGQQAPRKRLSVCVSSQVGCLLKCPFCATGSQGFERNLSTGEIVEQVLHFALLAHEKYHREPPFINNIVFMGMGEPLLNYDSVWKAIEILCSNEGLGIGARNITISTSGVIPGIVRLSHSQLQVGLAVSLHAGNNNLRNQLVPINRKYPLEQLIEACRNYTGLTRRRISFEYILVNNVNDTAFHANELAKLLEGMLCHVNLIAGNIASDAKCQTSRPERIRSFQNILRRKGINVTLRENIGDDIDGACGQLRSRFVSQIHRPAKA
jgi:23S rRNA (adenine2503-C2)-methyltransferase